MLCLETGCHTLPMPGAANPLAAVTQATATPASPSGPGQESDMVQVEFHSEGAKPERRMVKLQGEMHVQNVMEQANGFRRFSRAKIELVRRTPAGNAHKMDVTYDRSTHKIDPQTDYHARPGDRVIVTEDSSNVLTDMLKGVGVPLNSPATKYLISG